MSKHPQMVPLSEVLTQYKEYIDIPEPKIYPKLSVKLYGKGVVLDTSTDGAILKMKRHQIAKSGQVILSEIWGKKGAIGFVPPQGDGALCTSHFFLFDVKLNKIDPAYLQAIFTANYLQPQLEKRAKGTTGYAAVRPKHLLSAKIPLPPLDEQKRVVAIIEHLIVRIEEVRKQRADAAKEFEELFLAQLKKVINSAKGQQIDFKRIIKIKSGKGLKKSERDDDGQFKVYGSNGIVGFHSEYVVEHPTIIIGRKGSTGKLTLTDGPCWPIDTTYYVVPLMHLDLRYLHYLLLEKRLDELPTRSPKPGIRSGDIYSINVNFVEDIEEQRRIVAYLDSLQEKVDELKKLQDETEKEIEELIPSILDKAFKGEL